MDSKHKETTLNYYTDLFKEFGNDPKALGWGAKKGKQSIQFEILCEIGNISGCSILDVGCGFGDLYSYLKYRKKNVSYFGIDINPLFIDVAKKLHPNGRFELIDFQENKFKKKFDWVFFSGITSLGCNYSYIENIMEEMFRICKKGISMNFVGGKINFKSNESFYSEPEKIYSISKKFSNRATIRHDYAPYQFALYLYKNNTKTSNNVFKSFLDDSSIKFDDSKWHRSLKNTK